MRNKKLLSGAASYKWYRMVEDLNRSWLIAVMAILTLNCANGQDLSLHLTSSEQIIEVGKDHLQLTVEISNKGYVSYAIYGFANVEPGRESIEKHYDENNVCAIGVFFKYHGEAAYLMKVPPLRSAIEPITVDSATYVGDQFAKFERSLDSSKFALAPGKTQLRQFIVPLRASQLKRGKYTVFIIYYCGKNIGNVIEMRRVTAYAKSMRALVYHGTVRSNDVVIEVK